MNQSEITIEKANVNDAQKLLDIYAPYVLNTAITFEYDVPSLDEFKSRIENTLEKYPYLVARQNGEIIGYAYASAFKSRPAYDWSVETSIYVDQTKKHIGIGKKLYSVLENILKQQGILNVNACITYAEVEDEYLTRNSVDFHAHMGYSYVGKFHQSGYKFGRWYNMIWMEKHIGDHTCNPTKPKKFSEIDTFI